jgi:hypothetical protein
LEKEWRSAFGQWDTYKGTHPNWGGGYKAESNKGYTKDDITAIMGFARVYNGHNLPDIWELFNNTKGKNIDAYQCHLFARIKQYAYD